ncbi:hypothetical protein [Pseudomonas sp. EL_65y_Pfl1_R32]|uniref:hypothetical protein n=1 Tax=Pseudomonas sp. EL_65y_Pfl1_R32 TaxID=3088696 RepID=UPI0030DA90EF
MTVDAPLSLRQAHIEQVLTLFADPPTLFVVAQDCAQAWLDTYAEQHRDAAGLIYLGFPEIETAPTTYRYKSLPQLLLERLAAAQPTLLAADYHVVAQRTRETYTVAGPSLATVERLINQCGALLLTRFAQRLQAWWNESLPVNRTRWGYLSDELLGLLYDSPRPPGMSEARYAQVLPKSGLHRQRPNRHWSALGPALRVQTLHLRRGRNEPVQMLPLLVLSPAGQGPVVLFSPASGVQVLDNLQAVQALLPAYASPLLPGAAGDWFAVEVVSDPFDELAASYLQRQLREIASLDLAVPRAVEDYQALLRTITDVQRWFIPRLSPRQQQLRDQLPLWLLHVDGQTCSAYARLLQAQVLARQENGTEHFLDDIPALPEYAEQQLQACLKNDPKTATLEPSAISVSFDKVIAAAVPVPGGFIAGQVQSITVTLAQLALENLAGFPYTAKSIRLKGEPAPAWLTYNLLKTCVTNADVGQTYPALLKKTLVDDPVQATRRRRLFSQQLRIQLPMQALEWQVSGLHGLTFQGFRRLLAALQDTRAQRLVDGQAVAMWPLAFKATRDAAPDEVANMFIIGPEQGQQGAHLLYRPLCVPLLLEYPSLDALFAAVQAPGDLQASVLNWLNPSRQAVYAHGGFREPHVRRFLSGDEFTAFEAPGPAQLSKRINVDDPAHQVFAATAQAMVAQADRQSVSNAEQRWASVKQVGWLLFGILQPLLGGPVMLAGWLVQVLDSARQDMPSLQSDDDQTRNAAVMDVLANLMAILAHQASPHDARQHLLLEHPVFAPLAAQEPSPLPPTYHVPPVNFSVPAAWANARDVLTPPLQARLQGFSLNTVGKPWPQGFTEQSGPWQGLWHDTARAPTQWKALVRGQVFAVRLQRGRARVISSDGSRLGPWLKLIGAGLWDIDLQLRLSGGADQEPSEPVVDRSVLEAQYQHAIKNRTRAQQAAEVAYDLLKNPNSGADEKMLNAFRDRYIKELNGKVAYLLQELRLLRRLRELAPRPRYEEELSQIVESIVLAAQLSDVVSREHIQRVTNKLPAVLKQLEETRQAQFHDELRQIMRELATLHGSAIHWRTIEERYLEELRQVPRLGRDKARVLTLRMPQRPSILDLQTLQLTTLWSAAFDVRGSLLKDDFIDDMNETFDRARLASRSQVDLQHLQCSHEQRIELLESIDRVYAQTDDRIEFWRAMEPDKFDLLYLQKLQELLASLHHQAQQDLAQLLQPAPRRVIKPRPEAAGQSSGKIILTRNRDLYVARLSPEPMSVETAQLHDAAGGVIGSFTQADDGVWDQLKAPPPVRPDPELGALLKKADVLLRDEDRAIANVEAMMARANDAASLQELLEAQGRSRTLAAEAIRHKLSGRTIVRLENVQRSKAQDTEAKLRLAAARLDAAGLDARIRASRNNLRSVNDVAFLQQQGEVKIIRQGQRVPLRGRRNDFLQVYAVNDIHTGRALCFAHFHYASRHGPDDHYTFGHIKSPEQNRLGRLAQAEFEAQAFARMRLGQGGRAQQTLEIYRSPVGLAMARRLFFSLD